MTREERAYNEGWEAVGTGLEYAPYDPYSSAYEWFARGFGDRVANRVHHFNRQGKLF